MTDPGNRRRIPSCPKRKNGDETEMISTRGRYAIRVLIDLAEHRNGGYIPMKEVAERQDISLKYIEKIMPLLTKDGLVEGVHGKGGGYRLCRAPEDYSIGEILRLTEGGAPFLFIRFAQR